MTGFGGRLPLMVEPPPGPASRALAERLRRVESRNVTMVADDWPVFWSRAAGCNVEDADGNVYLDLTAGFGVAATGHANPRVAQAIAEQAARLPHGLGDVHPSAPKVELMERLVERMPAGLDTVVLGGAGAEAVEAALKTAMLHTGRPGILAFHGGYHGLTLGALAVTDKPESVEPFRAQVYGGVGRAPYPAGEEQLRAVMARCETTMAEGAEGAAIGAVLVEPIQGRGGIRVPAPGFLPALRDLCDRHGALLIVDEIYAGLGRTGRWLACEHFGVVPDLVTLGKALTGSLQLSALVGRADVMRAWPESTGEAIHTSTFLGNPVACAAGVAQLAELSEQGLPERAERLGGRIAERMADWPSRVPLVADVRGLGLMWGIELRQPDGTAATEAAAAAVHRLLREGVLILSEGPAANVLALTPPLVITEEQLDYALSAIEAALTEI